MRFKKLVLLAATAAVVAVAVSGCASSSPSVSSSPTSTMRPVKSVKPSEVPVSTDPLATGISQNVMVAVYEAGWYSAPKGCGCVAEGSDEEIFPRGSDVVMLRITLTGVWHPSQHGATTQDVTGLSLEETQFDGWPDFAVLDEETGPAKARQAGSPWLADGLFTGDEWLIENDVPESFVAAWFVPAAVDTMLLSVDIPSEPAPLVLRVNVAPPYAGDDDEGE